MKKLVFSLSLLLSFNVLAASSMVCNDQNSHSVYRVEVDNSERYATLTPMLPDSSALSHSVAELKFNVHKGLYMGKNKAANMIMLDINLDQMRERTIVEITASYSLSGTLVADEVTSFLCSVE